MTHETAQFLLDLVNRQQLNVGAQDFDQAVAMIQTARAELGAVLADASQSNG